MPNRVLLGIAKRPSVRRFVTGRKFARAVVERFVAGESIDDAVAAARGLAKSGCSAILDYLGENVANDDQCDDSANAYLRILQRLASEALDCHISVKLTQVGLDLSFDDTLERMEKICAKAAESGTTVAIDMESHLYTDRAIEMYRRLRIAQDNVVLCLQAYLVRTPADVEELLPIDPKIRLCKGAYNEPTEIVLDKTGTRKTFLEILERLLASSTYTAVATHDDVLIEETKRITERVGIGKERFEFQMLFGVRRSLQRRLADDGFAVRIYTPFGDQWYPYLSRRIAERPANLRFFLEALARG